MLSFKDIITASAVLAVAHGHGVILNAAGDSGFSVGFKVDPNIARNCTTINPCQQDATLIRDAEINANIVNECGRTEISGNIDIGENTENALAAGQVTKVKAGSELTVTIHQVNADGAGPYACDLDPTSNSLGGSGQIPLQVTNNVPGVNGFSQAKAQQFNITVKLPADLKCTGASTGDICTVRCRNNAVAGPFGGCFPIQQTDVTPTANTPQNIKTLKDLDTVLKQQQGNTKDFPAAVKANQIDGTAEQQKAAEVASKLLGTPDVVVKESPSTDTGPNNGTAAAPPATGNGKGNGNANANKGNGKGNGNANANNGNGNRGGAGAGANVNNGNGNGNRGGAGAGAGAGPAANGPGRNNGNQKRAEGLLRWARRYVEVEADSEAEDVSA
ncbi:hypothetical protein LY78DRAFT_686332 [Colletotrichum sublineola]|uniref:GEgh16 protein n=1 Tax=Colletotrichum sublineola TaxID=1173701 RepID=A0A066XP84_COLSU|nr:hypothetical protein LY78DRAFT_686332 [Colletotrichum sublineola]KDN67551.1 hypothetical protein CSUB01_03605 [Colletotrichum sublineola]